MPTELEFSISIHAPRAKVWETMLAPESYREWVNVSWPGSRYEGEWKRDASIRFLGDDSQGGTLATIVDLEPGQLMSAVHVALLGNDGTEDRVSDVAKGWVGTTERYTLTNDGDGTRLLVHIGTRPEWAPMFNEGWPNALTKLKEMCER